MLTLDQQAALQSEFQAKTRTEFQRQQREVLAAVRDSEALAGLVGKGLKQDEDPVPEIVAGFIDWDEADAGYADAMRPPWEGGMGDSGSAALSDLGVGASFDIHNPRVQEFLANYLPKLAGDVSTTTRGDIARVLSEGIAQGENLSALEGRVRAVFTDAKVFRAEAIARSETIRAMQNGSLEGWRQSGVVVGKEWSASGPNPCDLCLAMDGTVVGIDEAFDGQEGGFDEGMIAMIHPNDECDILPVLEGEMP
jgi:hypothetical protein